MKEGQKRRDKGTGSIYKRKDGRWEARLCRVEQDPIYVYGKSKHDVQNKLFAEQREPRARDSEGLTIGEWLDRWLEIVKETRRTSTYNLYKLTAENHIKPHIETLKLGRLSKAQVYDMFDALKKDGVRDRTLQEVYKVLHRALQVAFKRDKVARNVVALVDRPTATKKDRTILRTEDEVRRFRDATKGSRYEALYLTALDTGCRSGELRALAWDCVDLSKGLIHISATLTENEDGKLIATRPKTDSSIRTVKLLKSNITLLHNHQKQQMGSERGLSAWVFPGPDGEALRKDGFLRTDFSGVVKAAKVPGLSFHGLRHTHATMLAALGVPVRSIMDRLGHSTSKMTLEVYTHATTAMQDEAVAALDAAYETDERNLGRQIDRQPQISDMLESREKTRKALTDAG